MSYGLWLAGAGRFMGELCPGWDHVMADAAMLSGLPWPVPAGRVRERLVVLFGLVRARPRRRFRHTGLTAMLAALILCSFEVVGLVAVLLGGLGQMIAPPVCLQKDMTREVEGRSIPGG